MISLGKVSSSRLSTVGLLLTLGHVVSAFTASDIENLTPVSPLPVAVDLTAVVAQGETVFAVGGQGQAAVSHNGGVTWSKAPALPASATDSFSGLATDGTRYVALRFGRSLSSTDLETWTLSPDLASQYDIVHGEGLFITCGLGNSSLAPIRVSADGQTWSNPASIPDPTPTLRSVAYGGGVFVAGGDDGTLLHSADGQTWTTTFSGIPDRTGVQNRFLHISYANGHFLATGSSGLLYTSPEGMTWTAQTPDTTSNLEQVAYLDGRYIFGNTLSSTFVTTDLVVFERVNLGVGGTVDDFAMVGDTLVGVGFDGYIGTTTDGLLWTERRQRLGDNFDSLAVGAGRFVTVDTGTKAYYTSEDGLLWTARFLGNENLRTDLIRGGDRFLALGNSKAVISSDGLAWTEEPNGLDFLPDSLHFENGRFLVLGRGGELAESSDGLQWTRRETGSSEWLWDISHGEGIYVVTQNTHELLTSPDLVTWTTVAPSPDPSDPYLFVAYGDGRFIATSRSAPFAFSENGLDWAIDAEAPSYFVSRFGYESEYGFYLHGTETISRQLLDSSDLASWTSQRFLANSGLEGIGELNGVVVAVGGSGVILSTAANAEGFNGWVLEAFPGITDPLIIGPDADPDHDDQSNLEEYARGTDPNAANPRLETVLTRTALGTELRWTHPDPPADVLIGAEYSEDLANWGDTGLVLVPTDLGNGSSNYLVRITGEFGNRPKIFIRVRWSQVD